MNTFFPKLFIKCKITKEEISHFPFSDLLLLFRMHICIWTLKKIISLIFWLYRQHLSTIMKITSNFRSCQLKYLEPGLLVRVFLCTYFAWVVSCHVSVLISRARLYLNSIKLYIRPKRANLQTEFFAKLRKCISNFRRLR